MNDCSHSLSDLSLPARVFSNTVRLICLTWIAFFWRVYVRCVMRSGPELTHWFRWLTFASHLQAQAQGINTQPPALAGTAPALSKTTSTTATSAVSELMPLNCVPKSRPAPPDEAPALHVGGKRIQCNIQAPRVTGAGVASKQPVRLPPRPAASQAGLAVEDADVGANKDKRTPRELPELSAPGRGSVAAADGLSAELMHLLREAASERLASYKLASE